MYNGYYKYKGEEMKEYEIIITSIVSYKIEATDREQAINISDELYDNGDLFEMKEIDRGSEISEVTEIKGVK